MSQTDAAKVPVAPYRDADHDTAALLIVDMVSTLERVDDALVEAALAAAQTVADLRAQADALDLPTIYVNDNFGGWHSEKSRIVDRAAKAGEAARGLVDLIGPRDGDYFIIKPQFSGFYATNLPVLLPKLGVTRLILTGMAADICVLFTAADAHMRDYDLWIPADGAASSSAERRGWALEIARNAMHAETAPSSGLSIEAWLARSRRDR